MVNLARKTIFYEWRRFAPAIFAVAFSGVLLLVQAALSVGMFETIAVYIRKSAGDIWMVSPGTRSIDQGRPLSANIEVFARMNPHVVQIEPFSWGGGLWKTPGLGGENPVFLTGINTAENGMVLAHAINPQLRAKLKRPNTIAIDEGEQENLGVEIGDFAEINGNRMEVIGFMTGMKALGGINVVSSLATARRVDPTLQTSDSVAYFVIRIDDEDNVAAVQKALSPVSPNARFEAITAKEFADRTTFYWMFESGMGTVFVLSSVIAFFVSLVITSQTLMAAVSASIREYATMRALGVPSSMLRRVVLSQSAWVGLTGILCAAVISALIIWAAQTAYIPAQVSPVIALGCAALVMLVALGSGLAALLQLRKADPATLLR
jgi:putative ABC transport system permease protein